MMPTTFYFNSASDLIFGGPTAKAEANLEALRLLKQLKEEGRPATPEEQAILSQYSGWGASSVLEARKSELMEITTDDEWTSLKDSTINAHFTALPVVAAMWSGLLHLGIGNMRSIRALDPAAGTGNFRSMLPVELREKTQWVEVELDALTARILRHLHPYVPGKSKVFQSALQETPLPQGYFDLVMTNVPFGNIPVVDRSIEDFRLKKSLHDYFIVKGIDLLRPGGILAVITSRYTLDKADTTVRRWLASRTRLLAAIRLPDTTFQVNAGTEVVTDVIFLRKKETADDGTADWIETVREDQGMRMWWVFNQYYQDHPDCIIGEPASTGTMYGAETYTVSFDGDPGSEGNLLKEKLLEVLPPDLIPPEVEATANVEPVDDLLDVTVTAAPVHPIPIPEGIQLDQKFRLEGLREIFDIAKKILNREANGAPDAELAILRGQLNDVYDRFEAGFGKINIKANERLLKSNPAFPFLRALEVRKGAFAVEKAPIFFRTTVRPRWQQREIVSASDALFVCLDTLGKVDMDRIAQLAKIPVEQAIEELRGMVYKRPDGIWETADKYLAGNIREKLEQAEAAAELDSDFNVNVDALREALPAPLKATEIKARLGAGWIPTDDVADFISTLIERKPTVSYLAGQGAWSIDLPRYINLPDYEMFTKWGTGRKSALELLDDGLNSRTPFVYDETDDGKRVVDKPATLAAQAKLEEIKARFETWLWEDSVRAERLATIYNEKFNSFRKPKFDGAYLTLPGLSRDIELRKHQLDAVCRALQSQSTLLGHEVGLGKTLITIVSAMEMMRLGLGHKTLIVVPNHLTIQWRDEIIMAYPSANVLCATKDDLSKQNRGEFLSRIATGDWQFVVIPMSSNKLLPVGEKFEKKFITDEMEKLRAYLEEMKEDKSPRSAIKEVSKAIKRYQAKLDRLADMKKDSTTTITWEQLGIDILAVDEFHLFKNLYFHTKMTRIAGLPNANSERAFDLFMKVRCTLENGGRLIGATATPVSNTLAEVYTMQRYFHLDTLVKLGIEHFDAWAAMFADTVMLPEMTPDGSGFRINTRLAKFTNIPELSALLAQFCEVRTWAELGNVSVVNRPHLYGGKPCVVKLPSNAMLKAFTQKFAERAERVRGGGVDPREDNMLKITSDGRKAALDVRLLSSQIPANEMPLTKSDVAAEVIARIWNETINERSTQLVFCDLGTPAMNGIQRETELPELADDSETPQEETDEEKAVFQNVYADLKAKLISRGVSEAEIAFIHDAKSDEKRSALFEAVNRGRVRIMVGSTEKMGTGMNVQEKVVALHHLDAPWRPADIEQRIGRMLRQGNRYPEAFAFVYITEGSFDGYIWQVLETKARFIAQIMSGQITDREVEDVSETVLSMAEIKALASGNPKVVKRVTLQNEISKLETLYRSWLDNRLEMQMRIRRHVEEVEKSNEWIAFNEQAIRVRDANPLPGDEFRINIRGTTYTDRAAAGDALNAAAMKLKRLSNVPGQETRATVGDYRGFKIILKYFLRAAWVEQIQAEVDILLDFGGLLPLTAKIGGGGLGTIQSINATLRNLDANLQKEQEHNKYLLKQNETMEAGLKQGWDHEARFEEAKGELLLLDKELLGEGVQLPGMAPASVDIDAPEAAVKEDTAKPVQTQTPEVASVDENFDLEKIILRIREIHAALPAETSNELFDVESPVEAAIKETPTIVSTPPGQGMTWDQWLEQSNLTPAAAKTGGRKKTRVVENQMSLF